MILLRVLIIAVLMGVITLTTSELYHRSETRGLELLQEPHIAARSFQEAGFTDEASLLARYSLETAIDPAEIEAANSILQSASSDTAFESPARSFIHGALTGEPENMAGFLGSLSLDLFVVGDVRDLAVQGYKEATGGDGDSLILALSAIGLATTITPQLDLAAGFLKAMRRMGILGERMIKSLSKLGRASLETGNFTRLRKVVGDLGNTTKHLGVAPTSRLMKYVNNPAELGRLAKSAEKNAAATFSLAYLSGGKSIKLLGTSGKNVSRISKMVRRGSRLTKSFAKLSQGVPDAALWSINVLALVLLSLFTSRYIFHPGIRRRKRDHSDIPVLS